MTAMEIIIVLFASIFFLAGLALSLHGMIRLFRERRSHRHPLPELRRPDVPAARNLRQAIETSGQRRGDTNAVTVSRY